MIVVAFAEIGPDARAGHRMKRSWLSDAPARSVMSR